MRTKLPLTLWVATCLGGLPVSVVAGYAQPVSGNAEVPAVAGAAGTGADTVQSRYHRRPHVTKKHVSVRKDKISARAVPSGGSSASPAAGLAGVATGALPPGWQQNTIGMPSESAVKQGSGTLSAPSLTASHTADSRALAPKEVSAGSPATANTFWAQGTAAPSSGAAAADHAVGQVTKIFLPLGDQAGIAAFWSRNDFIIVSDHMTQMDASALRDTGPFSSAAVRTVGNTTIVTFHFDEQRPLALNRQPGGWVLALSPDNAGTAQMRVVPEQKDGGILYPMPQAGRIVELSDPSSGARLLVATSSAEVAGPRLPHRHVGYEIRPSVQGLVFAVESDQIEVRNGDGGLFIDAVGESAIPVAPAASGQIVDDRIDWSWLGLRSLPPAALREDYRRHWTQAAMLPPEGRNEARLAAARSAFALGDAHNARAILATAIQDDPELATLPNVAFLQAASELLADNVAGASMLESADTGVDGALWRGLYMERAGKNPVKASALLAEGYPRLADYPLTLRDRLQPEVAAFIAQYGSEQDLSVLSPLPDGPAYGVARAFMPLRAGDRVKALAAFQALAKQKDPVLSEAGNEQAITLRLAAGQRRPAEAAQAYGRLLLAGRLAGREPEVRRALVSAWVQAGEWEKALTAADEEMRVFPDRREDMMSQVQDILLHLAEIPEGSGAHPTDAIDAVALIESHVDQIPDGATKGRILAGLGAKLWGLGLPGRAAVAFERALPLATTDVQRAAWGAQLAQADIQAQRLGQARRALDETAVSGAGEDVASRRRVIAASLLAREGNRDQALQMLAQDETEASLDLRGRLLEEERKWPDAVLVVGRLATKNIPEQGGLSDAQQDLTVRLATDAARANDWETLDRLREWIGRRRLSVERQRIFELLVTSPEADISKRASGQ
ncbi:tetratricopeptide repeat protein [Acetobacter fallax]